MDINYLVITAPPHANRRQQNEQRVLLIKNAARTETHAMLQDNRSPRITPRRFAYKKRARGNCTSLRSARSLRQTPGRASRKISSEGQGLRTLASLEEILRVVSTLYIVYMSSIYHLHPLQVVFITCESSISSTVTCKSSKWHLYRLYEVSFHLYVA